MKKKLKNKLKIFSIFLMLFLIVGILFYFGIIQTAFGYTVLSISQAQFLSSSPDLDYQDAYLINVVVNKGGEQLEGTISPEMLAQYGITSIPDGDFKIYLNLQNVSCNYNIVDDNKLFYKVYQATVRKGMCYPSRSGCNDCLNVPCPYGNIDLNTIKKACKGEWGASTRTYWNSDIQHIPQYCGKIYAPMGTDTASVGAPIAGGDCDAMQLLQTTNIRPELGGDPSEWCYAMPKAIAWDGDHWQVTAIGGIPWFTGYKIDTVTTPEYEIEVILENSKGEKTSTILNSKESVAFLDNIGRVKIVGSLIAQEFCPIPSIEKNIVKDLNTNTFKTVDKEYYDNYQQTLFELINLDNNYYRYKEVDPGVGSDVLWDKMSTLNSYHRMLATEEITDNCKINGMIYSCNPIKDIIYPELQLIVKADWIGVRLAEGKPEIEDIKLPSKIYEGESAFVNIKVKNAGLTTDGIDISLECEDQISLGSVREVLKVDQSKNIYINFVADAGTHICTVYARSVSNPSNFDKKDIEINVLERDIPKPQSCENVPPQPCAKALWQGYPICSWNEQFCGEEETNWTLIITIIAVIAGILLFLIAILILIRRK